MNLKYIINKPSVNKEFSEKFGNLRFFTYLCTMIDSNRSLSTLLS